MYVRNASHFVDKIREAVALKRAEFDGGVAAVENWVTPHSQSVAIVAAIKDIVSEGLDKQ